MLNNCILNGYMYLFAGRGYSFQEFMEVLKSDFEDVSFAVRNISKVKNQYQTFRNEHATNRTAKTRPAPISSGVHSSRDTCSD